jgi:undecaprenyl-phosphate 4-deoxy-4-formamido-L-arabinose transferase
MKLSIVIPVYNSSVILKDLVSKIKFVLSKNYFTSFEIILVNDCSLDDSWNVIEKLSKRLHFIKGINLKYNVGQHGAIFVGLKYAKGNKIITMDDDLQHPPKNIINIVKKLTNYDICYTVYLNRKHFFWKILVSKANNIFASFLFNKSYNIYLSSFRGFTSEVKNKIIKRKPNKVFIDSLILKQSEKITSIKILHKKRVSGESNYNLKKLFYLWFDMIENFHFYPFRIGSIIGVFSFLFVKFFRLFSANKKTLFKIKKKTF